MSEPEHGFPVYKVQSGGGVPQNNFLVPGETCWKIDRADKLRIIVDGAEYFRTAKRAILNARQTVMMIGWDFDTRIDFEPEGATMEGPNGLGDFLSWITEERKDLSLYILQWDLGTFQSMARGMVPIAVQPMRMAENLNFRFDTAHPAGGAHHSKILVIDDEIAFCGGIDLTAGRWDTREHLDDQPCRHMPGEDEPSKPWHDVTTAIMGPLAFHMGELARQRWFRATGEHLDPPRRGDTAAWPAETPTFEGVPAAVARTYPDYGDYPESREIEAIYLNAIATVRDKFYVESQYFASARIARAIVARLAEADGPEFVVILPETSEGWLRQKAMDGARKRLLTYVWANDPHNRFAAYYPVTADGALIYVHAKVTIVDDWLIRVGSSNLNNRSMGFDTECDVAIEAGACPDPAAVSKTLLSLRSDLMSEHLNVTAEVLKATLSETGSLIATIERLRDEGRSLRPFTPEHIEDDASVLADNEFADPEAVESGVGERLSEGLKDLFSNVRD